MAATIDILTSTKLFIEGNLLPAERKEAQVAWIKTYLEFIAAHVKRDQPDEPYWNALVSEKMRGLKSEWEAIKEVLIWTASDPAYDEYLVELVLLLVHYMDSRLYNQERLQFVRSAAAAASRIGNYYIEALLRIDALGWTYTEESLFEEAERQLNKGMVLAKKLGNNDLLALGNAWLARVKAEKGGGQGIREASAYVNKAMSYKNLRPWIRYRVNMAAGDLAVHQKKFNEALQKYEEAKKMFDEYGGEGQNYQINPRVGLTYIRMKDYAAAEQIFQDKLDDEISIGGLYAKYGKALIDYYKTGEKEFALNAIINIKLKLNQCSSPNNILLKLINKLQLLSTPEIK